jgi:hypothetical protein
MMERKSVLLAVAFAALALVSVPGVIVKDAFVKYFTFMGFWNTATVKPSRLTAMPPMHARGEALRPAMPELRFVKISIKAPKAYEVKVSGEFNRWNPAALPLLRAADGRWEAVLPLPPGRYKYFCLIDGAEALDPLNPDTDTEGSRKVSVLTVR